MNGMGDTAQIGRFMPHGMCYLWNVRLLTLHVLSDAVIAVAYFSIPVILLFFVRKRRDLPFPAVFTMFGLFIVACGITHVMEIWTIWHPAYWLSGSIKALTAGVSIATAVLLVRIIPQALTIKGRADLYEQLAKLNATLEQQVLARTAKLSESERFLHAVADNVPSWVAYCDADSRCRFANAASLNWFGRAPESLLGLHISEVLAPDVFALDEPLMRAVLAGEPQKFERKMVGADGSNRVMLAHYMPDLDGDAVRGFYVVKSDVTDFKETEAQLARLNEHLQARTAEAETATSFKSQFLANMSHEIRSPMNAILGMLQLLQSTKLSARQEDYAAKAYAATQALLRLLNDILDFSKIEAGKLTFENAPFEIAAMVQDVSSLLSASLGAKPVELIFVIDDQLPQRLNGDAFRLRQVLLNLAGNAIKFTAAGEIIIEIEQVSHGPERCEVAFSVTDTGIGIAPEQLTSIFKGFNQGEASTTRRSGGTGLGLTISERIVSLMGGQLDVESELGRGSRFYFTLAFDCAEECAGAVTPQPLELPSTAHNRLLIVDDNDTARTALLKTTQTFGWASAGAGSGAEALELVRASGGHAYDMIFIDWTMPELDGWETALRIRELTSADAAIVLMGSAYGLAELSARMQSNPQVVDAVLLKPVTAAAVGGIAAELQARRNRVSLPPDRKAGPGRLSGRKILVVDDFAINLQIAAELLSIEGAQVGIADGGAEAIRRVSRAQTPFDIVLMDVQMPDMDGYETTRRLRELPQMSGVAIVAMTANAMEADKAACIAAGMDDYISKPIDIEVVVGTILRHAPAAQVNPPAGNSMPLTLEVGAALQRLGDNRPLFATIARRFIEESGALIEQLRAFLQIGALLDAAGVFHKLKGIAGTVGNVPLAEMASRLEAELNRTSRLSDPQSDLARLESLLAKGNTELERILAGFETAPALLESARPATAELVNGSEATLPAERHAVVAAAMDGLEVAAPIPIRRGVARPVTARLLIVDDDLSTIRLINEALNGLGEVYFATDGEAAFRLAREKKPDIVLLDFQMPGMDGFDVCAALKADPATADAAVFFITADTDMETETGAFGLGAADFIHKPISTPVVRARVSYHLVMKAQENELKRLAATDPLTGLSNRRTFDDLLEREWRRARRSGAPLSMIMVDLDHFKAYNDFYGHPAGDECLKALAGLLRSNVRRPEDFLARFGGEEFMVLLPGTGLDGASHVAARLCDAVRAAEMEHPRSPSGFVTASFGVAALVPDRVTAPVSLIVAADEALYEAKHAGRNRVVCKEPLPGRTA